MKRLFYSVFVTLFFSLSAFAQTEGVNFQGLARNAAGEVLVSQQISLRLSVLLGSESGAVAYVETRLATTNPQGIFSLVVGDGNAISKTGNFSSIDWGTASKFIKVEMDPNAGNNFLMMGTTRMQAVPFAFYAYGVDAENVKGILPLGSGGTGVASISELKKSLAVDQINNTSDASKPISTATQAALTTKANAADVTTSLAAKVDKVTGKELSTNDYTTAEKTKLAAITGTNTGDQDLSALATNTALALKANTADVTTSLATKANASDVTTSLATKVDKVTGKELSTNDYTTAEKTKLAAITGTNTGDQDLSALATTAAVALKANATDVTTSLATKVDKVSGKELSTNDYTTAEKTKLAAITGTNTGDQDLSGFATTTQLATKANAADVTTSLATKVDKVTGKELSTNDYTTAEKTKLAAITGTNTGDQDLSALATNTALALKANTTDVTTSLATKANTADVTTSLATKVDKVTGKELSTNDYTTAEKTKLAAITGTNTGDQDLSGYATTTQLATKANTADVTISLATKVDKVTGKELSTNDYTTAEKTKLAAITGTNTGDQVNITGNAGTATKLQSSVTINGIAFDGSANITVPGGVPYTGATQAVDLGVYELKTSLLNGITVGKGGGNQSQNTAIGISALLNNTGGDGNTANGWSALSNNIDGNSNTANGGRALSSNTDGNYNTASGTQALQFNTGGNSNTAIGYQAGRKIADDSGNNTTSDFSVYLGSNTKASADGAQNEIVIGYNAIGAGTNTIQLGNTAVTAVKTSGAITAGGKIIAGASSASSTSAVMEANSTTQGFLPPRLTTTQRDAIPNPVAGLTIWNTTNTQLEVYDGSYWKNMVGLLVSPLEVGDEYGGGKVFYIFGPSDNGFIKGQTHGLIAATEDQTTDAGVKWFPDKFYGATGTYIGLGLPNTLAIITSAIVTGTTNMSSFAAGLANSYRGGGYIDWFLPSKDELNLLYQAKDAIGGFATAQTPGESPAYWSSTQKGGISFTNFTSFANGVTSARLQFFNTGGSPVKQAGTITDTGIDNPRRVRAIRIF